MTADGESTPGSPAAPSPKPPRRRWRRLVLLPAALLVLLTFRRCPREQEVALVLPASHGYIRRLKVAWAPDATSEPLGGVTRFFPRGAPAEVQETLKLPDGAYYLQVSWESVAELGADGAGHWSAEVDLDGSPTRLWLGRPAPGPR